MIHEWGTFTPTTITYLSSATRKRNDIFYDVTGKAGEYLYIAGFERNNANVYGQFKDDYYMHKISIQLLIGNITITKNYYFYFK